MDIDEFQKRQVEYDKLYWQHNASDLEKIRHITLHVGKLLGKLSTYCEQQEHGVDHSTEQIVGEVIPDLQFYSFQLGNLLGVNCGEQYLSRLIANAQRHESKSNG